MVKIPYDIFCRELVPFADYIHRLDANEFFRTGRVLKFSFKSYHNVSHIVELSGDRHECKYRYETQSGSTLRDTLEDIIILMDTWFVSELVYES